MKLRWVILCFLDEVGEGVYRRVLTHYGAVRDADCFWLAFFSFHTSCLHFFLSLSSSPFSRLMFFDPFRHASYQIFIRSFTFSSSLFLYVLPAFYISLHIHIDTIIRLFV